MSAHGWNYLSHISKRGKLVIPRSPSGGIGAAPTGRPGSWSGRGITVGAIGSLADDLDRANARWTAFESDLRGDFEAKVAPWMDTINLGITIAERVDFSSPLTLWNSLADLASLAGPMGAAAGAIMRAISWLIETLEAYSPAFAIQMQDYDYAYLDRWIAENVLSRRGATAEQSLTKMYADGWIPLYALPAPAFCVNSGGDLGTWGTESNPSDATNLHLLSLVSGPRQERLPTCQVVSDAAMASWVDSREGRASVEAGRRLVDNLSTGGFFTARVGEAYSHQSEGLCFINNLRYDLNPGSREYNVWINIIVVNVSRFPNALINPIADYISFRSKAEELGTWNSETERKAAKASFGNNDQAFKDWNLLRLVYRVMRDRDIMPIAAVKEVADRADIASRLGPGVSSIHTAPVTSLTKMQSSTGTTVAVVGGAGLAALLLWLALS